MKKFGKFLVIAICTLLWVYVIFCIVDVDLHNDVTKESYGHIWQYNVFRLFEGDFNHD